MSLGKVRQLQILIVYDSKTGNTEKMAFAVAEGVREVGDVDTALKRIDETVVGDLLKATRIVAGSPAYCDQTSGKVKEDK